MRTDDAFISLLIAPPNCPPQNKNIPFRAALVSERIIAARMGDVVDAQTDTVPTHSDANYSVPSFPFLCVTSCLHTVQGAGAAPASGFVAVRVGRDEWGGVVGGGWHTYRAVY